MLSQNRSLPEGIPSMTRMNQPELESLNTGTVLTICYCRESLFQVRTASSSFRRPISRIFIVAESDIFRFQASLMSHQSGCVTSPLLVNYANVALCDSRKTYPFCPSLGLLDSRFSRPIKLYEKRHPLFPDPYLFSSSTQANPIPDPLHQTIPKKQTRMIL
jgi:hypothetical protein